jgi:hypothetical protein
MAIIIPKNELEIIKKHAADIFPMKLAAGFSEK